MTSMLAFDRPSFGIFSLASGETVVVPRHARARLRVHDGVVWATSSGDPDDVWLCAGQELTLDNKGRTVIESTARATIELVPAAANDVVAVAPLLSWRRTPAWMDDAGTLVALAGFVTLMATAASRAFL
ncbi:MAG: DUF2917 domain-containing protein [Betaproteobacteria bacterium]